MKKFSVVLLTLFAVSLFFAGDAFAKKGGKKGGAAPMSAESMFKILDKDGNGKLTLEEFKADKADAAAAEKTFKAMDKDKDGVVTLDEYKAANPDQAAGGKKGGKKGKKK